MLLWAFKLYRLGIKWLPLILLAACEGETNSLSDHALTFSLDRQFTGEAQNILTVQLEKSEGFQFKISGSGFDADILLGELQAIREKTVLSYEQERIYALRLTVVRPDGVVMADSTLAWDYSTERPKMPLISFSEEATNDTEVVFLLGGDTDKTITEISIEGDLAEDDPGGWVSIPANLAVVKQVSAEDGLKQFTIKVRNIYGNESLETLSMEIIKKTVPPVNCSATLAASKSATQTVPVFIAATNDGGLYYRVTGDVTSSSWVAFDDEIEGEFQVTSPEGEKNVVVEIRDAAGNTCDPLPLTVTWDKDYDPYSVAIKNDALYSDTLEVTLVNHADFLPNRKVEMYISGRVSTTSKTFAWIPYEEEVEVRLAPVDGNRFIYVQFRDNTDFVSPEVFTSVFLKPFLYVFGDSAPYSIVLSNFVPLTNLTISGCTESYTKVDYQSSYSCTPASNKVSVLYNFENGTTFQQEKNFP